MRIFDFSLCGFFMQSAHASPGTDEFTAATARIDQAYRQNLKRIQRRLRQGKPQARRKSKQAKYLRFV